MIDIIIFSIFGILAIAFSILVVEHRSLVYSAISLGFLGIANAVLFAFVGFTFIALFHLAVYVGAGVIFILFSVTMFKTSPTVEPRLKRIIFIIVPLITICLAAIFWSYSDIPLFVQSISYRELAITFTQDYWLPFIVVIIALVTTLIEGITLARREIN